MNNDILRDQWTSLGIAFNSKNNVVSDPETAIISFLKSNEFPDDRKMISLILAWLKENAKLVHIERLKSLTENLGSFELAILGAISLKCKKNGDLRWQTIIEKVKKRNTGSPNFQIDESEFLIKKNGEDSDFAEFGIRISKIHADRPDKILELRRIVETNKWIHHRILFGVNMRADVATVMVLKLAESAYQASKFLKCSFRSASRNWNDLLMVKYNG